MLRLGACIFVGALGLVAACDNTPVHSLNGTDPAAGDAPAAPLDAGSDATDDASLADADATPAPTPDAGPPPNALVFTDQQALKWLTDKCASCHGLNAAGQPQAYYSQWPMPANVSVESMEVDDLTPVAYETLLHKLVPATSPDPMPIDAVPEDELRAMISWFQTALPFAVLDADARYGNNAAIEQQIAVNFHCVTYATVRDFMNELTMGAFDRLPTAAELGDFTAQELASPITKTQRAYVVAKFDNEWKAELIDRGLRKWASVVGGGPAIQPSADFDATLVGDLQDEFYQLLKANYDAWGYGDYFTSRTVMVTPRTAPFYGCSTTNAWAPCSMSPPRGGFFSTLGYLNSRPQSFLFTNNNYGRTATMYFTLFGQGLRPQTDGAQAPADPLPTCLEPTDTRTYQGAPRGSAAVPEFSKICQSCHLSRYMTAGSILFRPFSNFGRVYDAATFGSDGIDTALYTDAVNGNPDPGGPEWMYTPAAGAATAVNKTFLQGLLTAQPQSCVATGKLDANGKPVYQSVASLNDLTNVLVSNQSSLARGFARHAQRAFANQNTVTLELGVSEMQALQSGGKLPDMLKAYFLSETFACAQGAP